MEIFISYSRDDAAWAERFEQTLKPAVRMGALTLRRDVQIQAGARWREEIHAALERADAALLLVSQAFLASDFIMDDEVPLLLARHKRGDIGFFVVLLEDCLIERSPLAPFQAVHDHAKPISALRGHRRKAALASIAREVCEAAENKPTPPAAAQTEPDGVRVSIRRLPAAVASFVGRQRELERLDALWTDANVRVASLVADGGVGKTALTQAWLGRMAQDGYRGAARVYAWSFYSQGTERHAASSDAFVLDALRWFGDSAPETGSAVERAKRLADLIRKQPTLLLLDGVEPLQHGKGNARAGHLKDPALRVVLRALAAADGDAARHLCLLTTRVPVGDLDAHVDAQAHRIDLENLDPADGVALLRALGVDGAHDDLMHAVEQAQRHALALRLLGRYVVDVLDGEVTREAIADLLRPTSDDDPAAQTMLAAYDRWLAADGNAPERAIVDLLGLFDRPADAASVEALRRAPAIPNLTDNLVKLAEGRWLRALRRLERIGLLLPTADGSLDAHPLVRTHAAARLESTRPAVWRAGNVRLYKHLTQTAEHRPNTVEGLMPLYQAVVHGCRAGRVQDAYDAVYRERIHRGGEVYSIHKLGLFGSELTVMSAFFEVPFARVHPSLRRLARADLMNDVGFVLRALGRLDESEAPMRASLEQSVEAENWTAAARSAGNLCILHVTLGALDQALADAKRSVVLADRSGATFERTTGRTGLANAHHQRGEMTSALALFEDAEAMQAEREPSTLPLYSLQGYWYCDLLLADGDVSSARAVIERAEYALEVSTRNSWALAIGLDNLSLARAWTILAHRNIAESPDASQQAQTYLDRAVEGLRTAGHDWILPHGLLARATFSRLVDRDASAADADLQEVEDLADRSGMRLFACDAHLERARLLRDLSTANDARDRARTHVAAAKKLIEETGYHRRDRELANLEAWLDENEPPHDLGAWS